MTSEDKQFFLDAVLKYNQLEGRLVVVASLKDFDIFTIEHGILFFMAAWSTPARIAFKTLQDVLRSIAAKGVLMYVADIDDLAPDRTPKAMLVRLSDVFQCPIASGTIRS